VNRFKALIFDLDGTLINSMPIHNRAWIETMAAHGHRIEEKWLMELAGVSSVRTVETFNQRFGWQLDPVTTAKEKEARYLGQMGDVKPFEKVTAIARDHFGKKPMALVTGGQREVVMRVLKLHQMEKLFPVQVCAEDTERGKQFPDPFLLAARQLNVNPKECVVFEDGDLGIKGAKAAGMSVIRVNLKGEMSEPD
jgi:HAD superfamily hydrolase (TIGR01509 family)